MTLIPENGGSPPIPEPEFVPPPTPPCEIHLYDGDTFVVGELDSWQWHERGMFATGKWAPVDDVEEQDLLFPTEAIKYVRFDFAAVAHGGEPDGS